MFRVLAYHNFYHGPWCCYSKRDFQELLRVCCFAVQVKVVTAMEILKNGRVPSASYGVRDHSSWR